MIKKDFQHFVNVFNSLGKAVDTHSALAENQNGPR